jgi:adenosylmethionine-8-amino-7-oxononanoate aminotransferase
VPGAFHAANTDRYRCRFCALQPACTLDCAATIEDIIIAEGPESVAAVFLEPVQNAGGCFPPAAGYFQEVRRICDKYGVLLVSDEVICAFGRLGYMFGCERYDYVPDIITIAKGLTSGYSPIGAMIASDKLIEPFLEGDTAFLHGFTFGGHPVSAAVAMANLDIFEREDLLGNVRANEGLFRSTLESLSDLPIVGEVRGDGYFYGIELVKDRDTRESLTPYNAVGADYAPMTDLMGACKRRGLLPFVNMSRLHVVPPCNVSVDEARLGLALLDEAIGEVEAKHL